MGRHAILARPASDSFGQGGVPPNFPNVFGAPESVKGKAVLCPKNIVPVICRSKGAPRLA